MAHGYGHLYGIYQAYDFLLSMALGKAGYGTLYFTRLILEDKPIPIFNNGNHKRTLHT